jgi:hypothetical protein
MYQAATHHISAQTAMSMQSDRTLKSIETAITTPSQQKALHIQEFHHVNIGTFNPIPSLALTFSPNKENEVEVKVYAQEKANGQVEFLTPKNSEQKPLKDSMQYICRLVIQSTASAHDVIDLSATPQDRKETVAKAFILAIEEAVVSGRFTDKTKPVITGIDEFPLLLKQR